MVPVVFGAEALDIEAIRRGLTVWNPESPVHLFDRVTSTNAVLAELARQGAPEGTVVLAEEQTAGRGRHGQPWFSPPGLNLYASVLFRPWIQVRAVPVFSFIASLAVADAIKREGQCAAIKWPNDVLVGRRKVAGTLVESASSGDRVDWVILGVGVNLNVEAEMLRRGLGTGALAAGSLRGMTGREIERNAFAASWLDHLARWREIYATEGPGAILAAWSDRDILTGRRVEVRGEGPVYEGRVLGLDGDGHLVVRDPRGRRRLVIAGEVRPLD
jgi:BirA family biotin operon repressor/biotin-[acetyl-CoA-carboxylase] ligase